MDRENMKIVAKFFALCLMPYALCAGTAQAAACHVPNLIKCLDSACVSGLAGDATVRCALCDSAAVPLNRNPSAQRASATTLETRDAPERGLGRYAWAGTECLQKISGCTSSDIHDNYDKLIEQSCNAAIANMDRAGAPDKSEQNNPDKCQNQLYECMNRRCGAEWGTCAADADFDRNFSACLVGASCASDINTSQIKSDIKTIRDKTRAASEARPEQIAEKHRGNRRARHVTGTLTAEQTEQQCKDGRLKQNCINNVCANFTNKCSDGRNGV
ncbi:MAG: hypothetical protein FWG39_02685, partial [Alphaproteobacteria bacterium]|nr:hypothetical protein [Alphaproteobacteria bacterium]